MIKSKPSKNLWYRGYLIAANLLVAVYIVLSVLSNEQDPNRLLGIFALISGLVLITVVDTVSIVKADL